MRVMDQMMQDGNLVGKFWRITGIHRDQITVTKYQRFITLVCSWPAGLKIGDRVSFIATTKPKRNGSVPLWQASEIHFHGDSRLKFYLSVLAVLIVLLLGRRHFEINWSSLNIGLKQGEQ